MQSQGQPIGAPTPSKPPGRFAGAHLGKAFEYGVKGMTLLDSGFTVASLMNSDNDAKERAREMASNLIDQGYTDYGSIMALAQSNPGLESAIGDIGASDYAKTAAGVGMQAGDILAFAGGGAAVGSAAGPIGMGAGALIGAGSALLGSIGQIDLQRKKGKRNEAFREQFAQELINRGLA